MRDLYSKINLILNSINYEGIWRGFHRFAFALYDDNNIYLHNETIPYNRRFLGNTSIEYNNEHIAIWKVDSPQLEDAETLAADLVHEMFHAFQREKKDNRFPNDLLLLNYPDNLENFIVKHCENLLLAKAFDLSETQEKRKALTNFMAARKYREGLIGNIMKQEYLSETIEGMADYAGCMALKQISPAKYNRRINKYTENLRMLDSRFFDIRRMLYYSGALFCILLSEADLPFYHLIGATESSLYEIAANGVMPKKPVVCFDDAIMSEAIGRYLSDKESKFNEFFSSPNYEVVIDSLICGYDPMNMVKKGDMVLCSHFIMLKSLENDEPLFIEGPVIVNIKHGTVNEVWSYIKRRE